ncbi:MAG: amidohydrolase family protein [Candidatus Thermoplasmatota archaeon]
MDLAIKNTTLITLQGNGLGIIKNGAVGIDMDKISFVGKTRDLDEENYSSIIDGTNHVTMPGLVDAHIHSGLALLRGTAQDVPEIEWMDKALGPITQHMSEDDIIVGSKLGVLEGLRSGTTTFAEFTNHLDRTIKEVYKPFSARVVGAETINEVTSREEDTYRLETSKTQLQENEHLFKKYGQNDLVDIMYGPQALDMISIETLKKIYERAEDHDRRIHMHVAQGGRERKQIENRYGCSTVEKLKEEDMLNERLLAAHCHATTQEEKQLMVEKGVNMVGCPSSIGMIDGIVPPIKDFLSHGGTVALGSDQVPGNGAHNLFREMRTISLLTKCRDNDPTALPPWKTLKLATKSGAQALGLKNKIGTLEEGKKADIITVNLENINLTPAVHEPFRNFIPNLIYSSSGFEVDNVIINGNKVLRNGEFVDIDETQIKEEAENRAEEILDKAESDWREADSRMVEYRKDGLI